MRNDVPARDADASPRVTGRHRSVKPPISRAVHPTIRPLVPRRVRPRHVWRRRVRNVLLTVLVPLLVWFGISFGSALANPAYGTSLMSRAAEWAREHSLGGLVTTAEEWWYRLNPPKVGGVPPKGSFIGAPARIPTIPAALPSPRRLHSPAGAWLPGEGVWHPAGRLVGGVPAVLTTTVRPDADAHELRGGRRVDGHEAPLRAAVLGVDDPRRRAVRVHRTDPCGRVADARRRLQRRLLDAGRERRLLHRPSDDAPASAWRGVAGRVPGRVRDRRRVGPAGVDVA